VPFGFPFPKRGDGESVAPPQYFQVIAIIQNNSFCRKDKIKR